MFEKLIAYIFGIAGLNFSDATDRLVSFVDSADDFVSILEQIGTIPETIIKIQPRKNYLPKHLILFYLVPFERLV